jgi:hypothetical protein
MKNNTYFGFIDEVGLSVGDSSQPFMAIGLLLIKDTSKIQSDLFKFHYSYHTFNLTERKKVINSLVQNPKPLKNHELNNLFLKNRHHEFKFDTLGFPNLEKYKELLDIVLSFDLEFHCIIVDKNSPDFDLTKYGTYWHAYCKFTKLLIKHNSMDKTIIPILDFLHKPNGEVEIVETLNSMDVVINSIQSDSKNLPLLQIADLFLGSVVFEKKKELGIYTNSNKVQAKTKFTNYLLSKLNRENLFSGKTTSPICFNIWNFQAKNNGDNTHSARPINLIK